MPLLKYLADTNVLSAKMAGEQPVLDWLEAHELPHASKISFPAQKAKMRRLGLGLYGICSNAD